MISEIPSKAMSVMNSFVSDGFERIQAFLGRDIQVPQAQGPFFYVKDRLYVAFMQLPLLPGPSSSSGSPS